MTLGTLGTARDRFISGEPNPMDLAYIMVLTLFGIVFIFGFIATIGDTTSAFNYLIYIVLFLFIYAVMLISNVSKGRFPGSVIFGSIRNNTDLLISIAAGSALGVLSSLGAYVASFAVLSWLQVPIPLTIATPQALTLTISTTFMLLIIAAFYIPEIEESTVHSVMVAIFTHIPAAILFLFAALSSIFVPQLFAFSLVLFFLAFAIGLFSVRHRSASRAAPSRSMASFMGSLFMSFIVSSLIFSLFHVYSAGSIADPWALLIKAFLFAFFVSLINWVLQNTIAGRIAHSINNSAYAVQQNNLPVQDIIFVPAMYAFLIILIYNKGHLINGVFTNLKMPVPAPLGGVSGGGF